MKDSERWLAWTFWTIVAFAVVFALIIIFTPRLAGAGEHTARFIHSDGCQDASGFKNLPNNNYGGSTTMSCRAHATYERHCWLRWTDVAIDIPNCAIVTSALCSLRCTTNTTDGNHYFGTLTESWNEGNSNNVVEDDACSWKYRQYNELSWSTAGGTGTNYEDTVTVTVTGWVTFTCVDGIQALVDGSGYGIHIIGAGSAYNTFASSENATVSNRPILNVTYVIPDGSALDAEHGALEGGALR